MPSNYFSLITEDCKGVFSKDVYIAPNIPEKKLNGAIKGITGDSVTPHQVLLVYDATLWGGAGDGILLSKDTLFYKPLLSDAHSVKFTDILSVDYRRKISVDKKGKENISESVLIETLQGKSWSIENENNIDFKVLAEWLERIHAASLERKEDETKIERRSLEDMPPDVRQTYLKIIINFLLDGDGILDEKECSQLYSLIARLNLSAENRSDLLMYQDAPEPVDELVETMCACLDDLARQEIIFSLTKDLIYIHMQTRSEDADHQDSPFIAEFAARNGVSEEQMALFRKAIDNERKIFDDDADDSSLETGFRNIASGAVAVGVPLAALYFSGSVIGLGATGITSGLAALGLGGVFGLSSMATGIGAVILIGLGAKKGLEHLTGQNEVDRCKRKEALLLAVNKHLQKSINILMQDINSFTKRLEEEIGRREVLDQKVEEQQRKLQFFVKRLRIMSCGGTCLSQESGDAELAALRQSLPRKLNLERLAAITDEPTTREFHKTILDFYEERPVESAEGETTAYMLRGDLTRDEAAYLSELLKQLKYFTAATLARQSFQSMGKIFKR